jgi:hypothetical protein
MAKKHLPNRLMKSKKLFIFIFLLLSVINTANANAQERASASSAKIAVAEINTVDDYRVKIIRNYLNDKNSPLAPYAEDFVANADKYNLDWKLVAAISGVESTYGQAIPINSYNAWGWGVYGDNVIRFGSWKEGIATISQGLRDRYMDKWGAKDIYEVGAMYAASPAWAAHVENTMNQIQDFALRNPKDTLSLSL